MDEIDYLSSMRDADYLTWWSNATPQERTAFHSRRLIKYFQTLSENKEQQESDRAFEWYLGLYLANQLLRISEMDNPDLSELKPIVKILEVDRKKYGTGWADLYWQTKYLLDNLTKENLNAVEEITG